MPAGRGAFIEGDLVIPSPVAGLVIFIHGSGSSRHSPRNRFVAQALQQVGLATLLADLLTEAEDETYANRFDIEKLTARVIGLLDLVSGRPDIGGLPVGLFGASTGAAAALAVAAARPRRIRAVVSRGGRPDLAMDILPDVKAPTLLIVGGLDGPVIDMNERALDRLACPKDLVIVDGATHLFEEPGKLEAVAQLAAGWFTRHLLSPAPATNP
jgi:pimeloyl-ACP methyl ester carboxylesterase